MFYDLSGAEILKLKKETNIAIDIAFVLVNINYIRNTARNHFYLLFITLFFKHNNQVIITLQKHIHYKYFSNTCMSCNLSKGVI